jgi:hypothetical protein
MKNKIAAICDSNFMLINILKLLDRYEIRYHQHENPEEQHLSFHVIDKNTGKEISKVICFILNKNELTIHSFFPNLYLEKDSKGLSAALAYLLLAYYDSNCKQQPITKVLLSAEKPVAENFWLKLRGLNLVAVGPSESNPIYDKYIGEFPETELNNINFLATESILRLSMLYKHVQQRIGVSLRN